jgi:hypothetical protein
MFTMLSSYVLYNLQRHRITIPMGTQKKGGRYVRLHSEAHQGNYRVFDVGRKICDCYESRAESLMNGTFVMVEVEPVVFNMEGGRRVS